MKKVFKPSLAYFLLIFLCLLTPGNIFGQDSYGERIDSMKVEVIVNSDATINVTEDINYNFGDLYRHGIFRQIPVNYKTRLGNNFKFSLSNISVTDEYGNSYPFEILSEGRYKVLKIGDPNEEITGSHRYIISYTVDRAIGYFGSYDEIYWNATGNEWPVPIYTSETYVHLPVSVERNDLQIACYFGFSGSTDKCSGNVLGEPKGKTSIYFQSPQPLYSGEGVTVAVGFPKRIVYEPTFAERFAKSFFEAGWYWLFLPILVFILMYKIWWKHGKDPKGTGVIVPEYDVPDELSPMQMTFVLKRSFGNSLSAEIVYLATHGFLKISKIPKEGLLSKEDYELELLKPGDQSLKPFQAELLESLFSFEPKVFKVKNLKEVFSPQTKEAQTSSLKNKVRLSDFKHQFYVTAREIEKSCEYSLLDFGYFPTNGKASTDFSGGILGKRIIKMIVAIFVGIFVWFFFTPIFWSVFGFGGAASLVISIFIMFIFVIFMLKMTEKGVLTKEKIKGFKLYLSVAEKDRIDFHNAPEKNPQQFEKFLPFAMALGVEKEWAKVFEGMILPPPNWYSDNSMAHFNASAFASGMSAFSSASHSSLATAPGSSSGSGGGGSSGGGGGGGGGGSW